MNVSMDVDWQQLAGRTVLVTGAAGGVGAVLLPLLLDGGARVIALDDLSSGRWDNLGSAAERVTRVEASVAEGPALAAAVPWADVDFVVHLAAISSLPACESDPPLAFRVNVEGTAAIVELARRAGVRYVVNASTSAVYERTPDLPFREADAVDPVLTYPQTKYAAERILASADEKYGMSGANLRFFNLFGPYQDFRRPSPPLLNYLVRQVVLDEEALLHSDGLQRRDYVSSNDACRAIGGLLVQCPPGVHCWNVCSGTDLSVREVVEIVSAALGRGVRATYRDARLLWDRYDALFAGPRSLDYAVVEKETVKASLGDPSSLRAVTGWSAGADVRRDIAQVSRAIAAHIRESSREIP
jgi:UDP-glucose 4-epimerase